MNGIEREEMVKQIQRNGWGWAARAWEVHSGISDALDLSLEKVKSHPSWQSCAYANWTLGEARKTIRQQLFVLALLS